MGFAEGGEGVDEWGGLGGVLVYMDLCSVELGGSVRWRWCLGLGCDMVLVYGRHWLDMHGFVGIYYR